MRNLVWLLSVVGGLLLAAFVLLPLLGMALAFVGVLLAVGVAAYLAAPLLAKLPWFRDRIHVDQQGGRRTVRFGGSQFTTYQGWSGGHDPAGSWRHGGDVIDVEGREVPEEAGEVLELEAADDPGDSNDGSDDRD